ncbi:unnamed protein product [Lasius platythorax]|uniref:Complementary sex determiner n=2 Tax=Lasius TaxID=488720 RepID=A0A0J7K029_LASNI|nr:complementary sex determiner [Lasius niger]
MNSHKVEKSKSPLEEKERMDKEGRLKLIREEWYIQQELERKHEARKLEMIEDYERRRAQELKIDHKQKSLRRSKSNSPQRRTTDYKYLEK